jgi:mannose-6-phosphate isomerase
MAITKLVAKRVEKVWGRRDLPDSFGPVAPDGEPVGEIWFEEPAGRDLPLLVKYLFTSEKLSIQVHPDDEAARAAGYARGKEEAWFILGAEPDARIGLGLKERISQERLRAAALDGSIEEMLDWRPVKAGDFLYSPAGTVHAIGPGLALIEIQQNIDLTYRLYDYDRPRELHLEEGLAAARPEPWRSGPPTRDIGAGREALTEGRAFAVERWTGRTMAPLPIAPAWLIPLKGTVEADGTALEAGSVWLADTPVPVSVAEGGELLVAYTDPG